MKGKITTEKTIGERVITYTLNILCGYPVNWQLAGLDPKCCNIDGKHVTVIRHVIYDDEIGPVMEEFNNIIAKIDEYEHVCMRAEALLRVIEERRKED